MPFGKRHHNLDRSKNLHVLFHRYTLPRQFSSRVSEHPLLCSGCGIQLQSAMPEGPGFLPSLDKGTDSKILVCQRCFNIKHYARLVPASIPLSEFRQHFSHIKPLDVLIVKVVDVFDFGGSFVPSIASYVGNKPMIIIVNKCDLLPTGYSPTRVMQYARKEARLCSIRNVVDVKLVSSITGEGVREAFKAIQEERRGRDAFVVGAANVGKSSFINQVLFQRHGEFSKKRMSITSVAVSDVDTSALSVGNLPADAMAAHERSAEALLNAHAIHTPLTLSKRAEDRARLRELESSVPRLTTSPLPGTTLGLVRVDLSGGVKAGVKRLGSLYDTPGIIVHPPTYKLIQTLADPSMKGELDLYSMPRFSTVSSFFFSSCGGGVCPN